MTPKFDRLLRRMREEDASAISASVSNEIENHQDIENWFMASWVDTDNNVWAVFNAGLHKSTDKGKTFVISDAIALQGTLMSVLVFQDSRGYLYWTQAGSGVLRRSTDKGTTWATVLTWTDTLHTLSLWGHCEDNDGNLFVGQYSNTPENPYESRIYRSTDNGATWSIIYELADRHIHQIACDPYTGYLYATTGDTEDLIIKSVDNGDNWTVIRTGVQCLTINFLAGARLIGDDLVGNIYKTTDDVNFAIAYSPDDDLTNYSTTKVGNKILFGQVSHIDGNTPQIVMTEDGENWEVLLQGVGTDAFTGPIDISNFGPDGNAYVAMRSSTDNIRLTYVAEIDASVRIKDELFVERLQVNELFGELRAKSQLYCDKGLEIYGALGYWTDTVIYASANRGIYWMETGSWSQQVAMLAKPTHAEMILALGDSFGNQFVITSIDNKSKNHDHGVQVDPTLFIHSDTDPDTDNTQWVSLTHNGDNAVLKVGKGKFNIDSGVDVNGSITQKELSADPADPSEGESVQWQSDGTGSGDDGDIMMKITAGGVTKTVTLVDFSAV